MWKKYNKFDKNFDLLKKKLSKRSNVNVIFDDLSEKFSFQDIDKQESKEIKKFEWKSHAMKEAI